MTRKTLGRLEPVELRDIWTSESAEFTPWLARPENLSVLGETLGTDLELEAQERAVGPFRADILCKDTRPTAGFWLRISGVGARMRADLRASNRRARHLPMRYETGLPSSVIRFRT